MFNKLKLASARFVYVSILVLSLILNLSFGIIVILAYSYTNKSEHNADDSDSDWIFAEILNDIARFPAVYVLSLGLGCIALALFTLCLLSKYTFKAKRMAIFFFSLLTLCCLVSSVLVSTYDAFLINSRPSIEVLTENYQDLYKVKWSSESRFMYQQSHICCGYLNQTDFVTYKASLNSVCQFPPIVPRPLTDPSYMTCREKMIEKSQTKWQFMYGFIGFHIACNVLSILVSFALVGQFRVKFIERRLKSEAKSQSDSEDEEEQLLKPSQSYVPIEALEDDLYGSSQTLNRPVKNIWSQ